MRIASAIDLRHRAAVLVLLLAGAAGPAAARDNAMHGDRYRGRLGPFECVVRHYDPRDFRLQQQWDRNTGTVSFTSSRGIDRVDVIRLVPPLDREMLEGPEAPTLHVGLFEEVFVPLVHQGVPKATVLKTRIEGRGAAVVFLSAMLLPSKRKHRDMLRGGVQYTDGRFAYMVSRTRFARPAGEREADVEKLFDDVRALFSQCRFPGQEPRDAGR